MCTVDAVASAVVWPVRLPPPPSSPPTQTRPPSSPWTCSSPVSAPPRAFASAQWEEDDAIVGGALSLPYVKSLVFGRISPHSSTTIAPFALELRGLYPSNVDVQADSDHLHELRIHGIGSIRGDKEFAAVKSK